VGQRGTPQPGSKKAARSRHRSFRRRRLSGETTKRCHWGGKGKTQETKRGGGGPFPRATGRETTKVLMFQGAIETPAVDRLPYNRMLTSPQSVNPRSPLKIQGRPQRPTTRVRENHGSAAAGGVNSGSTKKSEGGTSAMCKKPTKIAKRVLRGSDRGD